MKKGYKLIPSRLASLLDASGMSQTEFADRLDMTQGGISSILRGEVARPGKLKEMAELLGTSQEYLLGQTDSPRPIPLDEVFFREYARLRPEHKRIVADMIRSLKDSEPSQ